MPPESRLLRSLGSETLQESSPACSLARSSLRGLTHSPRSGGTAPPMLSARDTPSRKHAESIEETNVLYVPLARAAAARSPGHLHSGGPGARNRAGDHRDRGLRRGQERPVLG